MSLIYHAGRQNYGCKTICMIELAKWQEANGHSACLHEHVRPYWEVGSSFGPEDADVLHLHETYSVGLFKQKCIRILSLYNAWEVSECIKHRLWKKVDKVIVHHETFRMAMREYGCWNVFYMPYWVDMKRYREMPQMKKGVLAICTLNEDKKEMVNVICQGASESPAPVTVSICGYAMHETSILGWLSDRINEINCSTGYETLRYIGYVNDLEQYINKSEMVIAQGKAALEALACGASVFLLDHRCRGGFITEDTYPYVAGRSFSGIDMPYVGPGTLGALMPEHIRHYSGFGRDVSRIFSMDKILPGYNAIYWGDFE